MKELNSLFTVRETNLELVERSNFGGARVDFYRNNHNEVFMTIEQLARVLEYADRKSVDNMINRNEYLRNKNFVLKRNY